MKRSTVPAQITTVEDHIVGGLTPYQLALLMLPFCIGFIAYAVLPPNFHLALYKLGVVVALEIVGAILAIRVREKMLLFWIITIVRYNTRPRYHIYDKNDGFLRDISAEKAAAAPEVEKAKEVIPVEIPKITLPDVIKLEGIMADPRAKMRFRTEKDGRLSVIIQEIK